MFPKKAATRGRWISFENSLWASDRRGRYLQRKKGRHKAYCLGVLSLRGLEQYWILIVYYVRANLDVSDLSSPAYLFLDCFLM